MQKFKTYYLAYIACSLLTVLLTATVARADVFHWQGLTSNWNDLNNWQVNDADAERLPGIEDHVLFSKNSLGTTVVLAENTEIASLLVADDRAYAFTAARAIELHVHGHFNLNEASTLGNKLEVVLGATNAASSIFAASDQVISKIQFQNPALEDQYTKVQSFSSSARASCAFFTIIPEVTNPTCNGFSNGVAGVEVPSDGVGPFSYQWVGGPSTRLWSGVGAGTYTVIVLDLGQGGVPCSQDIFVNEPGPLTIFNMNAVPPTCADLCNGSAAPIVIGGNGGYTYSWSSGETGPTASALCASFSLTVTDQLGCSFVTNFNFNNAPDPIVINANVDFVSCFGNADGSIDLSVTGGVGSYTYDWIGPGSFTSASSSISALEPGVYTVTVQDNNACEEIAIFNITQPNELQASAIITNNLCPGEDQGAINLSFSGGTAPFTFDWSGPDGFISDQQNISDLFSGDYDLTLTDANSCTFIETYTLVAPASIDINATASQVACFGQSTGSLSANVAGGAAPYDYAWSGPMGFTAATASIFNLIAGNYQVVVTDANLCEQTADFDILQPDSLFAELTAQQVSCLGSGDGQITTLVNGGVAPYNFAWTGPSGFTSNSQDLTLLEPGDYNLTLTDDNGCVFNTTISVPNALPINIAGTVTGTTCSSGNTGAIEITITGGLEPFTYNWTGPLGYTASTQNISNLAAGVYNITATDDEGCSGNASFTVSSPAALGANFNITPVLCFGGNTGAINTTPSGGSGPYSFLWIGPAGFLSTSQNISGLLGGTYTLQLTDNNGCQAFIEAIVPQQPQINVTRVITNVTCFGGSNGAINITVSGGSPPYSYLWSGPNGFSAVTQDISAVAAGPYQVVVSDNNGCSVTRNYNINQPVAIAFNANITNVVCAGDSDGAIALSIASGTGPFTYSWVGPSGFTAGTQSISNLLAGSYTITATNPQGCQGIATYVVDESSVILLDSMVDGVSCFGESDGAITLSVSGGQEPYLISWTGPDGFVSDALVLTNLAAGNYNVQVSDDLGCTTEATFAVISPALLDINAAVSDITCFGNMDGSVSATLIGGTAPYNITWTGPNGFTSSDEDIANLAPGYYDLTVTDAQGCTASANIEIVEPSLLTVSIDATLPSCLSDDGELTAIAGGGTIASGYNYLWTNSSGATIGTGQTISNLAPGTFTILVTDDNGCQAGTSIQLLRESINLSASLNNVSCDQGADGAISLTPSTGTAPFTYAWTGPNGFTASSASIIGLEAGTYFVQVGDDTGCVLNESYDVEQPTPISFNPTIVAEGCPGVANGQIITAMNGGTPGFLFNWTGPEGYTNNASNASGLSAGVYNISATDVNGCLADTSIVLGTAEVIVLDFVAANPACFDAESGNVNVNITGGEAPFSFAWTGPNGFSATTQNIGSLGAGTFELQITDVAGCEAMGSVELTAPDTLTASINITSATCLEANGGADATAVGGTGALNYVYTDNLGVVVSSSATLVNVFSGLYTLTITDEAGCSIEELIAISDANGSVGGNQMNVSCFGGNDASITPAVTDGQAPFTFDWTGPDGYVSAQEVITDLFAGAYGITVTDDNGCVYTAEFDILEPAPITATATVQSVSCLGNDGAIDLSILGGNGGYLVSWTYQGAPFADGTSITDLLPGTYSYTITDAEGCIGSGDVDVVLEPDILVDATLTNALCGDNNTGAIDLAVSGGTAPYSFSWSGPNAYTSATANIAGLEGGEYLLEVSDINNCTLNFAFTIDQPDAIAIEVEATSPDCGESNGALTATISGGVQSSGYWIAWADAGGNNLGGSNPLENLAPGTYTLEVIDDNGCAVVATTLLSNPGISVVADAQGVSCPGSTDGSIALTITADNPPVTVNWTGPAGYVATGESITGLAPGNYLHEASAADGCSISGTVTVPDAPFISAIATITPTCFGDSNGTVSLELFNAVPDAEVNWFASGIDIGTGLALENLGSGNYTFEVIDGNGCFFSDDVFIPANDPLTVNFGLTDLTCNGSADGAITVLNSGGTAPYTFAWTGPDGFMASMADIDGLAAGQYQITVTDSIGCSLLEDVELNQPDSLVADVEIQLPDCDNQGGPSSISLTANGGTVPYTITWAGPNGFTSSDFDLSNLSPGTYGYVLLDAQGCSADAEVVIPTTDPLGVVGEVQGLSCNGANDGSIEVTLFGGVGSIDVTWTGPNGFTSDLALIEGLLAGPYSIVLTDSLGCSFSTEFEVEQPALIVVLVEATDASCNVSSDGTATLQISGGTAPYEVSWTGPAGFEAGGNMIENLEPGSYLATTTDANGCEAQNTVQIDFLLELSADAGSDQSICFSDQPFTINGLAQGADFIFWTDTAGITVGEGAALQFLNSSSGTYQFILTASNGVCEAVDSLEVTILQGPVVDAGPDIEVFAEQVFTLGGSPTAESAASFVWSPSAAGDFNNSASNPSGYLLETTIFTVTVIDDNGCIGRDSVTVTVLPAVNISSGFTPNGDGVNDTWIIDNIELFPNSVVSVFSRWGTLIFQQSAYNSGNAWDGTYSGSQAPVGTYYYAIELNDERYPEPFTGPLTIYR